MCLHLVKNAILDVIGAVHLVNSVIYSKVTTISTLHYLILCVSIFNGTWVNLYSSILNAYNSKSVYLLNESCATNLIQGVWKVTCTPA